MATQEQTAKQIWDYFTSRGWTKESVAGLLGNMQSESGIIADRWESDDIGNMSGGYGLVQWTPATKYINWANSNGLVYQDVISQCKRIEYEVANNIQWFYNEQRPDIGYITFKEFTQLTNVEKAADYFIALYEHPGNPWQPARQTQARYWYEKFSGSTITDPNKNLIWKDDIMFIYLKKTKVGGSDYHVYFVFGNKRAHISNQLRWDEARQLIKNCGGNTNEIKYGNDDFKVLWIEAMTEETQFKYYATT